RRIRTARPQLAVLMLTARTDEVDFVVGLDAGADDYVGKPFRLAELLARVRALLRRQQSADVVLDGGDIQLDTRGRRVLVDGADLVLANREFDLLRFLMERPGQVVSRDEILTEVWGSADLRSSKTLDMHISWLRRKIGDDQ
ncbi:response regulator transcription factor, partial [Streptomyces sp. SID10244]|nr:response regulator transcription factor [Streptomyces sp. SID10244]